MVNACVSVGSVGWIIFALLFLSSCFLLGIIRAAGVFQADIARDLGVSETDLGLALGLIFGLTFLATPFIVILHRWMANPRKLLVFGAVLGSVATVASSLVINPAQFCFCFAVTGIGNCFVTNLAFIGLEKAAGSEFNFLYGAALSGYAFGSTLVPLFAEYLLIVYGWRGAMLILGGLQANVIACSVATGPPDRLHPKNDEPRRDARRAGTRLLNKTKEIVEEPHSSYSYDRAGGIQESERLRKECSGSHHPESEEPRRDARRAGARLLNKTKGIVEEPHSSYSYDRAGGIQESERLLKESSGSHGKMSMRHLERGQKGRDRTIREQVLEKLSLFHFLLEPKLLLLGVAYSLMGFSFSGWQSVFVPRALERDLTFERVNQLTVVEAVANFIVRFTLGVCARRLGSLNLAILLTALEITSKLVDVFVACGFGLMVACAFMSGIALEGLATIGLLLGREHLPSPSNFDVLVGVYELFWGLWVILGGFVCGFVAGKTGSYDASYIVLVIVDVILVIVLLVVVCWKR